MQRTAHGAAEWSNLGGREGVNAPPSGIVACKVPLISFGFPFAPFHLIFLLPPVHYNVLSLFPPDFIGIRLIFIRI